MILEVVLGIAIFKILETSSFFGLKSFIEKEYFGKKRIKTIEDDSSLKILTRTNPVTAITIPLSKRNGIIKIIRINLTICSIIKESI